MSWLEKEGGLRFTCTKCGDCCSANGPTPKAPNGKPIGIVLVDEEDCMRAARRMKVSLDEFKRLCTWTYDDNGMRTLKMTEQGCILFDPHTRLCTIHGDHPLQCRTYPMWLGNVKTPEALERTCKKCPGAGTPNGNFIPIEVIRRCVMANVLRA